MVGLFKRKEMGFHGEKGDNPTATLVGFIIKTADKTSAIYQKAVSIIQEAIAKMGVFWIDSWKVATSLGGWFVIFVD